MNSRARHCTFLMLMLLTLNGYSQTFYANLQFDGLFDNREYKNDMLPQTIYGMRIMPQVGINYDQSSLVAGFSKIWEFGADDRIDPNIILYGKYRGDKWNALFGSIPRSELRRQLPDALLYDSIAFFEPTISGTLLQYHSSYFDTELYCNWFSRQTDKQREAFRIVWDGYVHYDGDACFYTYDIIHAGWFVTMTHWAKPKEPGHFIYDQFQFNPYIGFDSRGIIGFPDFRVMANAGLLYSMVRCRKDGDWHKPIGFLGDIQVGWKRFDIKTSYYKGGNQQPFLKDSEAGIAFHRSDPFYKETEYLKTEFKAQLINKGGVLMSFSWNLHMTSDKQIHNQQLITFAFGAGMSKNLQNR